MFSSRVRSRARLGRLRLAPTPVSRPPGNARPSHSSSRPSASSAKGNAADYSIALGGLGRRGGPCSGRRHDDGTWAAVALSTDQTGSNEDEVAWLAAAQQGGGGGGGSGSSSSREDRDG
ncbi:predicted protein [Verticillium alfalfae VaMs.102]|uniref:Predicted protein n=1 Tax=Verticillium alfalfae (strain VaMs.102 / ATCC MYA-4576 / FGSC 10136) TaxID=526221 RepID=C9STM0_VERA1|nr:predicted protein [Verticillium alfalfae VaMs.102]EEY22181.1 predicted protein [Verticillium alfalfae VaMs.102]